MKIFYDTEFVDTGNRILPISIGMVTENGREFYAVFEEIGDSLITDGTYQKIVANEWLMHNVMPHLPLRSGAYGDKGWEWKHAGSTFGSGFALDLESLDVMPHSMVRKYVRAFIDETPDPELWAWYSAYDHVMLAQLFGRMIDKPEKMPMWTNDLKQLQHEAGVTDDELEAVVPHDGAAHNALVDAKWNLAAYEWLTDR